MKILFAFVLIIVLGFIAQLFLPWWIIAIVCFLIGLTFIEKTKYALLAGFFGVFVLWGLTALVKTAQNDFILINRMSELLPIHNTWLLMLATAVLGGLIGLMSTLSGYFLQTINNKPKRKFK
jgi:membrane-bound ClpP family serine protease